jgi:hypothetical protein
MYNHPQYRYLRQVQAYERQFRRKVPQWVKALNRDDAQRLLRLCCDAKWRLSPTLLLDSEQYSGPYSLWAPHELSVDAEIRQIAASRNKPLDLMNLPFDPAQAAMRACLRKGSGRS